MSRKFGVLVAPEGKRTRQSPDMVLNSDVKQFKYFKTVIIRAIIPTTGATIQFYHGLHYVPAYSTMVKGPNGRWGRIAKGTQSVGMEGWNEFPYAIGTEIIDANYWTANMINFVGADFEATFRLTLFYDEMEKVF